METVTITNRIASLTPAKDAIEQSLFDLKTGEFIDSYFLINSRNSFHKYHNFKFIYKTDGTLWHEANLFIMDHIKKRPSFSLDSINTYEQALREFIAYCEPLDKNGKREVFVDYKKALIENYAPTHRFREHLIETKIKTKKSLKAVERLMPPVCAFYEWLIENGNKLEFDVPLWNEKVVSYKGREMIVRDVCQYENRKSDGQYVYDDGMLRPLTIYEERMIRRAVTAIGNPEYKMIFFVALNSMARKQTIMTLRIRNILNAMQGKVEKIPDTHEDAVKWLRSITWPSDMADCSILVGRGHGADVKGNNKNYPIKIKGWLLKQLVVYMVSERAYERRAKSFQQKTELDEYIFLTDDGNPMYHAESDPGYYDKKKRRTAEPQKGNGLDQFINNELRPWLRLRGVDIEFHFHCLRATGAIRFLEERARKANRRGYSQAEWASDIEALSRLMGHSSTETTYHYLNYMSSNETLNKTVDDVGEWYFEQLNQWSA